jgi:nucleotide-binding universal stress UspA family protein
MLIINILFKNGSRNFIEYNLKSNAMKKILVPIDFTETSENAFVYALEMAKSHEAELILLHAFELPIVDSQVTPINFAEIYTSLELANTNQFEDELQKLNAIAKGHNAENIVLSHIMMDGDLLFCVKEVIKQENIDFVVMGTKGASGWFESFIGTNTCSIISDVWVPVLSVAQETKYSKIETIGFTTCYKEDEIHALNEVVALAKKLGARVKCLYVKKSDSEVKGESIAYWESIFENEKDLEFFIIPSEDVESTIEDFIINQNIDLLAMVTHKKNFFTRLFTTSTTQKMSQHSKTPILALHE